jgi:acyl phosphate:glycerol-3-phosphate acyltransferase
MSGLYALLAIVGAYLIGSISFAVLVSRAMGLADPRSYGSGNPGATNVLRTGNRAAAVLTLAGDAAKGFVAVVLAVAWAPALGFGEATTALVALAVFVGHLYPVFHGFKGGKGVATAAGALLALSPWVGAATILTWVIIAFFFRYSSLAALVSAVFAPFYYVFLFGTGITGPILAVLGGLLVWRHRGNIANLMKGKETRIGEKRIGEKRTGEKRTGEKRAGEKRPG